MVGRYKQWLGMMTKAYPQAKELWDQVKRIKALDEIVQQLEQTSSSRISFSTKESDCLNNRPLLVFQVK